MVGALLNATGYFLSAFVPKDKFWMMFLTFSLMTGRCLSFLSNNKSYVNQIQEDNSGVAKCCKTSGKTSDKIL